MNDQSQQQAEAVENALERQRQDRRKDGQADAVTAAIEDAQQALEGAIAGGVPDGDLIGRKVVRPVLAADGTTILHTGQTVSAQSLDHARREGAMHDLNAAVDDPASGGPLRVKSGQPQVQDPPPRADEEVSG